MQEHLDRLENELKLRTFSKATIKNYLIHNKTFLNYIKKQPEEIIQQDIDNYLQSEINKKTSPRTLALKKAALKFFYYKILEKDIIKLPLPKIEASPSQTLTKEEVSKLIQSSLHHKSKLIVKLLYSTGLKVSELTNLRLIDINLDTNVCWIKKENRARDRTLKFSESLFEEIKKYIKELPEESEFLISHNKKQVSPRNIQKIIQRTAKRAEINKKVTPSTLRQSYTTHLLEEGIDTKTIKQLLGYSRSTTKI